MAREVTARDSIERWQWMRNAEGGQSFGNQWEIRPLTAAVFRAELRAYLPLDGPRTWRAYRACYPTHTHYVRARRMTWSRRAGPTPVGPWCPLVPMAGAREELRPRGLAGALWARRVTSWTGRAARRWGRRTDTDALGLHDAELDRLDRATALLQRRRGRLARGLGALFAQFLRRLFEDEAVRGPLRAGRR